MNMRLLLYQNTFRNKIQPRSPKLLQHLILKGLQPVTINDYLSAIRRIGNSFNYHIYDLTEQQLVDFFVDLRNIHT